MEIYRDYKWYSNPDAKYAYGDLCVKECPGINAHWIENSCVVSELLNNINNNNEY